MKFTVGRGYRIDVKEPSGLAFLSPALGFVTVDDDSSAIVRLTVPRDTDADVGADEIDFGAHRHLLRGLEGIAYDPEAHALLVISEDSRIISELALEPGRATLRLGDPVKRKTLDKIAQDKSHGWEGLALLAAKLTPDGRARLLAVNKRDPRGVAVLDRATLTMEAFVELPREIAREADDLSDLTVDSRTGHLFLLSDESAAVIETIWRGTWSRRAPAGGDGSSGVTWTLAAVGRTDLPESTTKHRLQPEGLAFDDRGDLWIVAEGDRSLRRLIRG